MINQVMSASEAEERWKLMAGTVRASCTRGKLKGHEGARKSGNTWLVTVEAMEETYGSEAERYEFKLMNRDYSTLNHMEKRFVRNVDYCVALFNKKDFPMPHSKFTEMIFDYMSPEEQETFGNLDFFTTVESEVYKKFNLTEDDEDKMANGTAYIIFK